MAYDKLSYNVDNLDKAKNIVESNMEAAKTMLKEKEFPERWRLISDHHWGEKITLANRIIDYLNSEGGIK